MRGGVLLAGFPAICTVSALAASDAPPEGSRQEDQKLLRTLPYAPAAILTSMVLSAVSSSLHVSVPLSPAKSAPPVALPLAVSKSTLTVPVEPPVRRTCTRATSFSSALT